MEKHTEMTIYEKNAMGRMRYLIDKYCDGSQQRFVEKTKLNKASVSQYVNGKNVPSNITAISIANVFDINPAWIMGFDVPMERTVEPVQELVITPFEGELVRSYRNASDDTQIAVCAVLGLKRDSPSIMVESSVG